MRKTWNMLSLWIAPICSPRNRMPQFGLQSVSGLQLNLGPGAGLVAAGTASAAGTEPHEFLLGAFVLQQGSAPQPRGAQHQPTLKALAMWIGESKQKGSEILAPATQGINSRAEKSSCTLCLSLACCPQHHPVPKQKPALRIVFSCSAEVGWAVVSYSLVAGAKIWTLCQTHRLQDKAETESTGTLGVLQLHGWHRCTFFFLTWMYFQGWHQLSQCRYKLLRSVPSAVCQRIISNTGPNMGRFTPQLTQTRAALAVTQHLLHHGGSGWAQKWGQAPRPRQHPSWGLWEPLILKTEEHPWYPRGQRSVPRARGLISEALRRLGDRRAKSLQHYKM